MVSYRDWIETFQPAFKACGEAGAMSYMCSYNAINGVPSCANRELLTDLLRENWKFNGFVVSDCGRLREVVGGGLTVFSLVVGWVTSYHGEVVIM